MQHITDIPPFNLRYDIDRDAEDTFLDLKGRCLICNENQERREYFQHLLGCVLLRCKSTGLDTNNVITTTTQYFESINKRRRLDRMREMSSDQSSSSSQVYSSASSMQFHNDTFLDDAASSQSPVWSTTPPTRDSVQLVYQHCIDAKQCIGLCSARVTGRNQNNVYIYPLTSSSLVCANLASISKTEILRIESIVCSNWRSSQDQTLSFLTSTPLARSVSMARRRRPAPTTVDTGSTSTNHLTRAMTISHSDSVQSLACLR
ncbi:hypothetical protein SAMD00019534_015920, partial [Acytostelium subglobosum LB1]|uniref:hypothetical protein n=1 Tax=Acytostelium subglobosum LB1 TaxID=1410327 RepID=UPI000644F6DD